MTPLSAKRPSLSLSPSEAGPSDQGAGAEDARPADSRLLRLKAVDAEDLAIISAQLQDAIVPVTDMAYLGEEQAFAMVVNRFMWEAGPIEPETPEEEGRDGPMCPLYLRTNCAVEVRQVSTVRSRNIDFRDRGLILCLLALRPEPEGIDLHFSGGGVIRLVSDTIDCRVRDLDEPWPTRTRPAHPPGDDADEARS